MISAALRSGCSRVLVSCPRRVTQSSFCVKPVSLRRRPCPPLAVSRDCRQDEGTIDRKRPDMQVLADFPWENGQEWLDELRRQGGAHRIHAWPDIPAPDRIEVAIVWTPSADLFEGLNGLRALIVPGAGIDQLSQSGTDLPDVPIVRLADPVMATRMAEYVLAMVLGHHRQLGRYRDQQANVVWARHFHRDPADVGVGILGMGVMGTAAAHHLQAIGYAVTGWSRTEKSIAGIKTVAGEAALEPLIASSDVLVCLLPLTGATRGILNARVFDAMPEGALVINAARGGHLVVPDLIAALDDGKLNAVLDVFEDEPLPPESPLWRHPAVTITPHVASLSNPVTGVRQIVRALDRIEAGERPDHVVDRSAGY
ncbi:MAG: 2-hydroxyacid dehydrogenase [Geminicoccaceae bacterium]